jgi:hypothetical protein
MVKSRFQVHSCLIEAVVKEGGKKLSATATTNYVPLRTETNTTAGRYKGERKSNNIRKLSKHKATHLVSFYRR